jgi:hypothetical protein
MADARNKYVYDIYKKIYESLMTVKLNFEFFKKPDGQVAKSFTEFIQCRDAALYLSLLDIKNITNEEDKQMKIINIISEIIYALEEFIDSDNYRFLYTNLPGASANYIIVYMTKIINFFKSYKVYLLGINTVYIFNDPLQNTIRAYDKIDSMIISYVRKDMVNVIDGIQPTINITPKDKYKLLEKIYLDVSTWSELSSKENMSSIKEKVQITPYY